MQRLTGFIALCPGCAEGRHIHLAEANGRYEVAYKRLLMINRWTQEEAERHIARARALCERRSGIEWVQDFGFLGRIGEGVERASKDTVGRG